MEAKGAAHICWNCQNAVPVLKKLMIGKNRVLLHQDTKLLHHHVYEDFDMDTVVGSGLFRIPVWRKNGNCE